MESDATLPSAWSEDFSLHAVVLLALTGVLHVYSISPPRKGFLAFISRVT
jgi:hypothetical protein